jgi:predicted O-methyltransferase YrrM
MVFGALETFNVLSLKLWIKNPARARAFSGRVFRNYMSLVGEDRWFSRGINEILPEMNEWRIVIEHTPGDGIDTPIDELAYLALLTRNLKPRNIFEIGTYHGRTALNFALNSPDDCVVYTLDLPLDDRASALERTFSYDAALIRRSQTGVYYRGKESAEKIRQLYGNSLTFDFSSYAGRMDLVFVDGSHHYEAVRSDTLNALRMATEGGFIIWHDFGNYGDYNDVTRAVLDLLPAKEIIQIGNSQLAIYRNHARSTPAPTTTGSPG